MIDLVALDSLRAIDSHGSVVAAADVLGFTPSAVSQQIKRLERQTGVPLLERVGRGVMLTRHGRHLVEEGTRLLAGLEELQSGLHRQAATVAGHVRLAAFATALRGLVAPALPPLMAQWPDLRVTLAEREPKPGSRPATLVGLSLPPRKAMTIPATHELARRAGPGKRIHLLAADLSGL